MKCPSPSALNDQAKFEILDLDIGTGIANLHGRKFYVTAPPPIWLLHPIRNTDAHEVERPCEALADEIHHEKIEHLPLAILFA